MNNTNDILERILLNMTYDSKKTLSENKSIIINEETEYCKKLKADVKSKLTDPKQGTKRAKDGSDKYGTWGDGKAFCCNVEGQENGTFNENCRKEGSASADYDKLSSNVIPDFVTNNENYVKSLEKLLVKTIDYEGKPLYIYGQVQQTFGDFIGDLEKKIDNNEFAYRKTQLYRATDRKPHWVSYKDWDDFNRGKIDRASEKWRRINDDLRVSPETVTKPSGEWEYTDDWIGYFAKLCRADLRKDMQPKQPRKYIKSGGEYVDNSNYGAEYEEYRQKMSRLERGYNEGYLEPVDVPTCVKDSLKNLKTKIKPSSPYTFLAYNRKNKDFDFFFLSFSCKREFETTDFVPSDGEFKEKKTTYLLDNSCTKDVQVRGYYSKKEKKWFNTIKKEQKKEYEKGLVNLEKSKSTLTQYDTKLNNQVIQDIESENKVKQLPKLNIKDSGLDYGGITLQLSGGG